MATQESAPSLSTPTTYQRPQLRVVPDLPPESSDIKPDENNGFFSLIAVADAVKAMRQKADARSSETLRVDFLLPDRELPPFVVGTSIPNYRDI